MSTASPKTASKSGPRRGPKAKPRTRLGKYTLGSQLGKGGYGEVYAGSAKTGPRVAIKLLDAALVRDEDAIARFQREAETAQRLDHPNIVKIVEVGASRDKHFIAMELVGGGSLKTLIQRELDVETAQKLLVALADAARGLAYAHERGVVHRDVKPANILLTRSGRAKVADFGLARAIDQSSMTTDGKILGTASYMSPEQARGARATSASDVYSLGVILYEIATGKPPFHADSPLGYLYQHAEVEPEPPAIRAPFPPQLGALALACLNKASAERPTMTRVAEQLAELTLRRPRPWLRIAILVALLAIAIAAFVLYGPR